jgi:hypothetical protein
MSFVFYDPPEHERRMKLVLVLIHRPYGPEPKSRGSRGDVTRLDTPVGMRSPK